jgi:hypothetical protein
MKEQNFVCIAAEVTLASECRNATVVLNDAEDSNLPVFV